MVECTCLIHIALLYRFDFITSICSGLVVQLVSALLRGNWQDFNLHDASRGHSAIAEFLIILVLLSSSLSVFTGAICLIMKIIIVFNIIIITIAIEIKMFIIITIISTLWLSVALSF